jgi:hypothetical protein
MFGEQMGSISIFTTAWTSSRLVFIARAMGYIPEGRFCERTNQVAGCLGAVDGQFLLLFHT